MFDGNHVHQIAFLDGVHHHVAVWTTEDGSFACFDGTASDFDELVMGEHATVGELVGKDGPADSFVWEGGEEVFLADHRFYAIARYNGGYRSNGAICEGKGEFTSRWDF